jgi:hypothetical protein
MTESDSQTAKIDCSLSEIGHEITKIVSERTEMERDDEFPFTNNL